MREFMTPNDFKDEFISFLKRTNSYYTDYYSEIQNEYTKLQHNVPRNVEEWLEENYSIKILSFRGLAIWTIEGMRILQEFIYHFNEKHEDDIIKQMSTTAKLFARYARETKQIGLFNRCYGSYEKYLKLVEKKMKDDRMVRLGSTFPEAVSFYYELRNKPKDIVLLNNRFTTYYTNLF